MMKELVTDKQQLCINTHFRPMWLFLDGLILKVKAMWLFEMWKPLAQ
jgi:hypothetical protein